MIQISVIPQEFVDKYNIKDKGHNIYIFIRATKGICGIPQAIQITHDALVQHLEIYG